MSKVMLDMDGVIADFYRGFSSYLNDHYHTTLDLTHEPSSYNFDSWGGGVSNLNVDEATLAWIADGGYRKLPIYSGAKEFYETLTSKYDISVVTARLGEVGHLPVDVAAQVRVQTLEWFKEQGLKPVNLTFEHLKIPLCKDAGIGIMI